MAEPSVLQSYLVNLGLKGPSASETSDITRAFDALSQAAAAIAGPLEAAALAMVAAVEPIANGLAKLFFESSRVGTTVEHLRALEYGVKQFGGSAEAVSSEIAGFAQKLNAQPVAQAQSLKTFFPGLTDDDLKDRATAFTKIGQQIAYWHTHGQTARADQGLRISGMSLSSALAMGTKGFAEAVALEAKRIAGLDDAAKKAVAVMQSVNKLGDAISVVIDKAVAELFTKYGETLNSLSAWVDDNQPKLIGMATTTVEQFTLAFDDLKTVGGPAFKGLQAGFDGLATTLDRLLGNPDGKHGGIHGLHYALDLLGGYIAGSLIWKVVKGLGGVASFMRMFGPAGIAAATAYEFFGHVPSVEGNDTRNLYPGQHSTKPSTSTAPPMQTSHQKETGAATPDSASPSGSSNFHENPAMGRPNFFKGKPLDLVTWKTKGGIEVTSDRQAAPHMKGFLEDLEDEGAPLTQSGIASYVDRRQASGAESMHSHGGAIDVMSTGRNRLTPEMQEWVDKHPNALHAAELRNRMLSGRDFHGGGADMGHWEWGGASNPPTTDGEHPISGDLGDIGWLPKKRPVEIPGKAHMAARPREAVKLRKQLGFLLHPNALGNMASVMSGHRSGATQFSRDAGTKTQNIKIAINAPDPHSAASEVARHLHRVHSDVYKDFSKTAVG